MAFNPLPDVCFANAYTSARAETDGYQFALGNGRIDQAGGEVEMLSRLPDREELVVHICPF